MEKISGLRAPGQDDEPDTEELAAALAAIRLFTKRREGGQAPESRWLLVARAEAVAPPPRSLTWSTAEWPR